MNERVQDGEHPSLPFDCAGEIGSVFIEDMGASGFLVSPFQDLIFCIEKEDFGSHAFVLEVGEYRWSEWQEEGIADIDADGDPRDITVRFEEIEHFGEQDEGEIVDAIEAEILKGVQCSCFTRAPHAGNEYKL